ncbi:MAG: L-glyceraldehyde 3-phosphate reductase [Phycisphaerae bacterium]|nr:L-glyceraldehyde 3-phosphate reductase [Phycisphaerae bacterium]
MAETIRMSYRSLGQCGLKVSVLSLGGWLTFGKELTEGTLVQRLVRRAVEAGINFFDLADVYAHGAAEEVMGRALVEWPRHSLVISSKVFYPTGNGPNDRGLSRKHIMESAERSLRRIGTDYLDLYFCHRYDAETPLEETARAMDDLVRQGKVLYWGTSEWSGGQIRAIQELCRAAGWHRPQVEQPQYSLIARKKFEQQVRPAVLEAGLGAVTWSPLAMGLLTGKYDEGLPADSRMAKEEWLQENRYTAENRDRVRRMKALADRLGCSRAQLAIAWVVRQEAVSSVILGVTRPEQLEDNLRALQVNIGDEVNEQLNALFPVSA